MRAVRTTPFFRGTTVWKKNPKKNPVENKSAEQSPAEKNSANKFSAKNISAARSAQTKNGKKKKQKESVGVFRREKYLYLRDSFIYFFLKVCSAAKNILYRREHFLHREHILPRREKYFIPQQTFYTAATNILYLEKILYTVSNIFHTTTKNVLYREIYIFYIAAKNIYTARP